jgi:hypothetical protein
MENFIVQGYFWTKLMEMEMFVLIVLFYLKLMQLKILLFKVKYFWSELVKIKSFIERLFLSKSDAMENSVEWLYLCLYFMQMENYIEGFVYYVL